MNERMHEFYIEKDENFFDKEILFAMTKDNLFDYHAHVLEDFKKSSIYPETLYFLYKINEYI